MVERFGKWNYDTPSYVARVSGWEIDLDISKSRLYMYLFEHRLLFERPVDPDLTDTEREELVEKIARLLNSRIQYAFCDGFHWGITAETTHIYDEKKAWEVSQTRRDVLR